MQAQRQRLAGERGQKRIKRPELEAKYGYDTKYAMHVIRLGLQGVELLQTGRLTLPLPDYERSLLLDIRGGKPSLQDVLTMAGELEAKIKDLMDNSPLPEKPDYAGVEKWMLDIYLNHWKATQPPLFIVPAATDRTL